jgi:uncharacterized membrane protein
MELVRGAALIAATITMGLMAGVFGLYSHTIMPGLRRTDDRTFVGAFQSIDRTILNPWFMASFFGALALTGLAAARLLCEAASSADIMTRWSAGCDVRWRSRLLSLFWNASTSSLSSATR